MIALRISLWSVCLFLAMVCSFWCFYCVKRLKQPSDTLCVGVVDLDAHGTTDNTSNGLLQFGEPPPPPPTPTPPPPPDTKPESPPRSPSPPRQRPQYLCRASPGQRGRGRGQRGALGRGQMFEDPAVMRTVEGRPSLKVLEISLSKHCKCPDHLLAARLQFGLFYF